MGLCECGIIIIGTNCTANLCQFPRRKGYFVIARCCRGLKELTNRQRKDIVVIFLCLLILYLQPTDKQLIYGIGPGVGSHKVIEPPPRTALAIFRNIRSFLIGIKFIKSLPLKVVIEMKMYRTRNQIQFERKLYQRRISFSFRFAYFFIYGAYGKIIPIIAKEDGDLQQTSIW